jgi:hypothetical protein
MLAQKYWHKSLTEEVIADAAKREMFGLDNPGFCLICGSEHEGCEPDARNYPCDSCGAEQVFGAQELLLIMCP